MVHEKTRRSLGEICHQTKHIQRQVNNKETRTIVSTALLYWSLLSNVIFLNFGKILITDLLSFLCQLVAF